MKHQQIRNPENHLNIRVRYFKIFFYFLILFIMEWRVPVTHPAHH